MSAASPVTYEVREFYFQTKKVIKHEKYMSDPLWGPPVEKSRAVEKTILESHAEIWARINTYLSACSANVINFETLMRSTMTQDPNSTYDMTIDNFGSLYRFATNTVVGYRVFFSTAAHPP